MQILSVLETLWSDTSELAPARLCAPCLIFEVNTLSSEPGQDNLEVLSKAYLSRKENYENILFGILTMLTSSAARS